MQSTKLWKVLYIVLNKKIFLFPLTFALVEIIGQSSNSNKLVTNGWDEILQHTSFLELTNLPSMDFDSLAWSRIEKGPGRGHQDLLGLSALPLIHGVGQRDPGQTMNTRRAYRAVGTKIHPGQAARALRCVQSIFRSARATGTRCCP